jgi:hypothetical protein
VITRKKRLTVLVAAALRVATKEPLEIVVTRAVVAVVSLPNTCKSTPLVDFTEELVIVAVVPAAAMEKKPEDPFNVALPGVPVLLPPEGGEKDVAPRGAATIPAAIPEILAITDSLLG